MGVKHFVHLTNFCVVEPRNPLRKGHVRKRMSKTVTCSITFNKFPMTPGKKRQIKSNESELQFLI